MDHDAVRLAKISTADSASSATMTPPRRAPSVLIQGTFRAIATPSFVIPPSRKRPSRSQGRLLGLVDEQPAVVQQGRPIEDNQRPRRDAAQVVPPGPGDRAGR